MDGRRCDKAGVEREGRVYNVEIQQIGLTGVM